MACGHPLHVVLLMASIVALQAVFMYLPGPGIDPSLFFDDDGRVYYTGNRVPPTGQTHAKHMEIWLQELDVYEEKLIGGIASVYCFPGTHYSSSNVK